jgi:hypothetical protein
VLDNLPGPEEFAACAPSTGNGHVLVTSRHRGLDQHAPVLIVDVFDEQTGADYLTERTGRPGERAAALGLARALGGLPLALAHAGAYCALGTSLADYQEMLALPASELFTTSREAFYRETVASTWSASISAAARVAPAAPEVLALAAYLAPTNAPVALLQAGLGEPDDPRRRKQLLDALTALATYSLIDRHDDQIDTHRLLQKVIRDDANQRGDQSASANALDALTASFPRDSQNPQSWPRCETLIAHVAACVSTEPHDAGADGAITLLNRVCDYLLAAGDAARAAATAMTAIELGTRLLGAEHPDTLSARANLAASYRQAGRTAEAITLEEADE